jgi:hypothetical protein
VDEDTISAGLEAAGDERLDIAAGDSEKAVASSYKLGPEVLFRGIIESKRHYEKVIGTLADDMARLALLVEAVFYQALNAAGADFPPMELASASKPVAPNA